MRDSGWPSGQVCAIIQGSGAKTSVAHHYVSSEVDVVVGVGVVVHVPYHYVSADVGDEVVSMSENRLGLGLQTRISNRCCHTNHSCRCWKFRLESVHTA